jgi:signal transduction histidine kinase/ActR/RegA family two-component response regulator
LAFSRNRVILHEGLNMLGHYEVPLVVVSVMVSILASYTALALAGRVSHSAMPAERWWWITGGACAMGTGIWSMHFIGMLAFRLPIPLGYDLEITVLSWLLPVSVSVLALWQLSRADVSPWQLAGSALLIGLGINAMHYVGMAAMQMHPAIVYAPNLVAASILIAVSAASASLWIAFKLQRGGPRIWRTRATAALLMGAAIAGMHYTGMAAAIFPAGSVCLAATGHFTLTGLALMVIVATVSILGVALLTAVYDARLEARSEMAAVSERNAQDRQRLLEQERVLRTEAERINALKDQFLATLSHELRTPLNAILGWTQMLRLKKDPETMVRGVQVIDRNARLQAQLIEELLDMSRIVSGKVRLEPEEVDAAEVVQAEVDTARPAALAKQIKLTVDVPVGIAHLHADPGRLQQVLGNLLTNAIKFTPEGGRVSVALRVEGDEVLVTVSDTGIGIDPAFLQHVFELFRQADGSTTRRHSGLGIGLAIARQLVELHGGTLEVASEGPGKGACFTLRLPLLHELARGERAEGPAERRVAAGAHQDWLLAGVEVLVVDDEADARDLLYEVLTGSGARVTAVGSAVEALRVLQENQPDVLVSDLGMPETDGFELLRRLRQSTDLDIAGLPALALSAYTRLEDKRKALEAGFDAIQPKPVDLESLVEAVGNLTQRRAAGQWLKGVTRKVVATRTL